MSEPGRGDPDTTAAAASTAIEWLDSVDSTNAEAHRRAAAAGAGGFEPIWIAARHQTAGRGRRGRAWRSDDGNLMATLLLDPRRVRPQASAAEVATLSFVASLAVFDATRRVAPAADLLLKWPNDVLLAGRKVAGLLLEGRGSALAIGIGVNLATAPASEELPAEATPAVALTAVRQPPPTPAVFLRLLAAAMDARIARWAQEGFVGARVDWLAHAAGLGAPLIARAMSETLSGRFVDVDAAGALVLETSDGVRRVHAADVFFPTGAPR